MTGIIASFIGTFFSCIIAMILCRYVARIAIMLGPWEYFSLCLCAIVLVVSLSKGNMLKGLAGAAIGLLLSCVGAAPVDAVERFTFGNYNLYSGLGSTTVMLGIMLFMTAVAVFLAWAQIPTTPFILANILGPMLEKYMRRGLNYSTNGMLSFVTRPVSLIFLLVAVVGLIWPIVSEQLKLRKERAEK